MPFLIPGMAFALVVGLAIGFNWGIDSCIDFGLKILNSEGIELNIDKNYFNQLYTSYSGEVHRFLK